MSDNFIFDGKHSLNDMGLYTEIITRPLFAEPKTIYEDIPGTDGEHNFTLNNPKSRMCFKPRIIELECHFAGEGETRADYINKISELASWLAIGENKVLAFDDEPNMHYMAHAANLFNIESVTDFSGTFPLVFKCDPFKYSDYLMSAASDTIVTIDNAGYYVCPIISVAGYAPNGFTITNSYNGKSFTVNTSVSDLTVVIDMENMTAEMNGISILHKCEGDFFELPPGKSEIILSGDTELSAQLTVEFFPRYL